MIGPSGIGKTLLAMAFIDAGLRNGERCLHLSLQETEGQVREKAAAAGFDWSSYADDQLMIHHIAPVEVASTRSEHSYGRSSSAATSSAS